MQKRLLPVAAMEKIMKQAGADRVSDGAKVALKNTLEEVSLAVSAKAWEYAKHAGRKTVKEEDVLLAAKAVSFPRS